MKKVILMAMVIGSALTATATGNGDIGSVGGGGSDPYGINDYVNFAYSSIKCSSKSVELTLNTVTKKGNSADLLMDVTINMPDSTKFVLSKQPVRLYGDSEVRRFDGGGTVIYTNSKEVSVSLYLKNSKNLLVGGRSAQHDDKSMIKVFKKEEVVTPEEKLKSESTQWFSMVCEYTK
jgi:hypothetical protein